MKIINHFIGTVGTNPFYTDGKTHQGKDGTRQDGTGEGDAGQAASEPQEGKEGTPFASFRLAVNHSVRDEMTGGWRDVDTTWFEVACFGPLAENVRRSVVKGERVLVIGRICERQWTSAKTGEQGSTIRIVADAVGHNMRYGVTIAVKVPTLAGAENSQDPEPSSAWGAVNGGYASQSGYGTVAQGAGTGHQGFDAINATPPPPTAAPSVGSSRYAGESAEENDGQQQEGGVDPVLAGVGGESGATDDGDAPF